MLKAFSQMYYKSPNFPSCWARVCLSKSELTRSGWKSLGPSFNLGLNISSSSTNVASTGQAVHLSNLQFQKDLEMSKSCHLNGIDITWVLRCLNRTEKNILQKNIFPDLTMIKWSSLGMSESNCWWRWKIGDWECSTANGSHASARNDNWNN